MSRRTDPARSLVTFCPGIVSRQEYEGYEFEIRRNEDGMHSAELRLDFGRRLYTTGHEYTVAAAVAMMRNAIDREAWEQ